MCGNTTDHCTCEDCTDYRRINREWRQSNGTQKWRYDGWCGSDNSLPDGTPGQCNPDGDKPCCSSYGWCGNTPKHCSCSSCTNYTFTREWRESNGTQKWRHGGECGRNYPLPDGTPAQCDPNGDKPCCSSSGECGNSREHCTCSGCTDYKLLKEWRESNGTQKWRYDGKCGSDNPLPDGAPGQCDPDGDKPCCSGNSISWYGWCGNTTAHCTCKYCTDYRRIYREWNESNGTQKWRYDGRCGGNYPLPDGTPGQCDPDGDKPCCNRYGECGNTTDHCTCRSCTNYTFVKEWNESNGTQKWRYDGKCGSESPLPDGTPSQCDPDGDKPCCNGWDGECGHDDYYDCLCDNCVDYRVVREIRNSGTNCIVTKIFSGYLKHMCFDEEKLQLHFKCLHSDHDTYTMDFAGGEIHGVSKLCKNDKHAYQACGFDTQITNTDVLCGGYFCEQKNYLLHYSTYKYIVCRGDECKPENRDCKKSRGFILCNDKCEDDNCQDESFCNGYQYGVNCDTWWGGERYVPVHWICGGDEDCDDGSDERNCSSTNVHTTTCTHYREKVLFRNNEILTVPIHNYTRCSVVDIDKYAYPYCLDYLDQTNCSDMERVGGYCEVNGYNSSVSKYMICYEYHPYTKLPIQLCDDGFQNNWLNLSISDCRVHKHWMCDGVTDCTDGADENPEFCKTLATELNSNFFCKRRFQPKIGEIRIPLSWIMDNEIDCMDGQDENPSLWDFCQEDVIKNCKSVFKCPGPEGNTVRLNHLCNGIESCGDNLENKVCQIARDFPSFNKIALFKGTVRDVCQKSSSCEIRDFRGPWSPSEVFGVEYTTFDVPTSPISCKNLFGEHYLFLSCMGVCSEKNTTCPLENNSKLQYNSCPGQFPDRAITLADNSFLTFVNKSKRGDYHQEFYQCKNSRCIEYKQVCDLVDDCGDMSDEINCTNHMICEDTKNSIKHHFISLERQKCDGIYDCFDLSDECNESCLKQILGNWVLKCTCWLMGILALVFNFYVICNGLSSITDCQTESMMKSKLLMSLIGSGDFLIGLYLIILSVYDSLIFGNDFCRKQAEWLTGYACLTLGVISTVGSQISLFSMTVMSFIRMFGLLYRSMRIPGPVNKKAVTKVVLLCSSIIILSLAVAVIPLVPSLEDYFVQGMHYDPAYKVFIGFPNKDRHIKVLEEYYPDKISSDLSWKEIGKKVNGMFSQDYGTLSRKPVHFYGNDGVCLFKYFVRTDDARRSRQSPGSGARMNDPVVWTMLVVNLICFMIMTHCYIRIIRNTRQSTQTSGQYDNPQRLKENRAMEKRIMVIIVTDFMCWVPFIFISGLHNLGTIDASDWYTSFAMIVLPLNSVINPLIYDKQLGGLIMRKFREVTAFIKLGTTSVITWIIGLLRRRTDDHEPEMIPMEIMNHPQT